MFELREWLKEKKHKTSPWGERLDDNGYAKSLFTTEEGVCFLCGVHGDVARHELIGGIADRPTSKAVGLWIYLCPHCHGLIHQDQRQMHKVAEEMFIAHYSANEFWELYHKNYL